MGSPVIITPADEDEITEIVDLSIKSVHAVESPAAGTPWLFLKSVAKSDSAEADLVQETVSGERSADAEQPRHKSGQFLPHTSGETASLGELAGPGAATFGPHASRSDLETALKAATDPRERERLGELVTLAKLKASHSGAAVKTDLHGGEAMESQDALIKQLEDNFDKIEDPALKAEVGQRITFERLRKAAQVRLAAGAVAKQIEYDRQVEATNQAIRDAQGRSTSASLGQTADPRGQTALIGSGKGTPQSLGAVDPQGARGDFTGDYIGRMEREPAAVQGQIEDELAKSTDPTARNELAQRLTYVRLRRLHEPARSNPRAAQKALHERVVKATKRAALGALR
jgi:hypothetical protein